jgi:pimeloyl-ACP methyl ester carboxylesterase
MGRGQALPRAGADSRNMAITTPLVELADVVTSDGLRLGGALAHPRRLGGTPRFDAVLMMHGAAANFHDGFFRTFSAALVDHGVATLRANNRGHDIVNRGDGRGRLAGFALEAIEDAGLDWGAWLDFLEERAYRRILLFGHSLGAVKSAYYLATQRDPRVTGLVLASPPRFNTERMLASAHGPAFAASLAEARALDDAGRGLEFIRTTFPRASISGANAYLTKYGSGTRFDVFSLLPATSVPVLALTGSEELGEQNFCDHPAEYAAAQAANPNIEFTIVPEGDHHYSRAQAFAVERLFEWIDTPSVIPSAVEGPPQS